jgi:hypothetical protein
MLVDVGYATFGRDTNNSAESEFSRLLGSRCIRADPISTLISATEVWTVTLHKRAAEMAAVTTMYVPTLNALFAGFLRDVSLYQVQSGNDGKFRVGLGRLNNRGCFEVVDFAVKECSCGAFQNMRYPCIHAHAAAVRAKISAENFRDYVGHYYFTENVQKAYSLGVVAPSLARVTAGLAFERPGEPEQKPGIGRPRGPEARIPSSGEHP